jgi:LacI family transcriptional regulator
VLPYDTVVVENRAGARDLARQLIGLGHDRFAILAGPSALQTSRDRVAGFRAGLPPGASAPRIVDCEFTRDGGYAGMRALLDSGLRGGCVFAVNDVMAVGAIAALREAHVDVPAGIAIAGFDDIATLRDIAPPLTTVHVPLEDLGMAAAEFVLDDHRGGPRLRRVRPVVVLRDSTAREGARPSTDG